MVMSGLKSIFTKLENGYYQRSTGRYKYVNRIDEERS